MAANTTSGNGQSYEAPGTRIFQGLDPDIVMIQEFNVGDNSTATIGAWVTSTFGAGYTYFREPGGQSIPNGVISRYPILSSGEIDDTALSDRDFAWAKIDVPGSVDLWAISVHLKASSGSANSTTRNNQATAIRTWVQANVPSGAFLVIAGDYNTYSNTESCLTTLGTVVVSTSPYPADQSGNANTNEGRSNPYDRVLVNTTLNAYKTAVTIGSNSHTNGLVFDSEVYSPLSAVSPVLSGDSHVTGMQHMGVVKDFLIPSATATATATPTASPTPTPSPTATASLTATPSPTASQTASLTPSPTESLTPSPTATISPTASPTASATASPTASLTATPSPSPTASPTPAPTVSPTPSATPTPLAGENGFITLKAG